MMVFSMLARAWLIRSSTSGFIRSLPRDQKDITRFFAPPRHPRIQKRTKKDEGVQALLRPY
jgi:hypothetical protein